MNAFFHERVRSRLLAAAAYLARLPAPPAYVSAAILLLLIVGCSFFRHSFGERTASVLSFSDPHVYWTFANLGEKLTHGPLVGEDAINPYGIAIPLIYALLRNLGAPANYATVYDLAWGANVVFLILWVGSAGLIARRTNLRRWTCVIVILTAMILAPPLLTTKSPWVIIPMISALRYVPFLLLFGFIALMHERAGFAEYIVAAFLSVAGLCFSPDTGLVATIGFTGAILLDRRIRLGATGRACLWLVALGTVFALCAWVIHLLVGYDLTTTIGQLFGRAVPQSFNVILGWDGVRITIFALAIFTVVRTAPEFFKSDLPIADRAAFIAAGLMLIWGVYLVRRPDNAYWIYDALFLFIAIRLASAPPGAEGTRAREWQLYAGLAIALILSSQALYRTNAFIRYMVTYQLREASQPKRFLDGLYAPPGWVTAASTEIATLNRIQNELGRPAIVVTGQPYLTSIHGKPGTQVWEIGYSFNTNERITHFADGVAASEIPVVIDVPATRYFFDDYRALGRQVANALSKSLTEHGYTRAAEGTDNWIVLLPPGH